MFEGIEFAKGRKNVPQSVEVAVESDLKMQFYDVSIEIVARFGGLRYISDSRTLSEMDQSDRENLDGSSITIASSPSSSLQPPSGLAQCSPL